MIDAITLRMNDCEQGMHDVVMEGGKSGNERARGQLHEDATRRFKQLGIEGRAERLLLLISVKP